MWIYILIALAVIVLLLALVIYHDTHSFVVRKYEIHTDKIKGDLTFALLSDLHGYVFGDNNDKLIQAVSDANPDIVLCAGDMFTGHYQKGGIIYQPGFHVLSEIAKSYPVYMANGNHEYRIKIETSFFGNFYDRYRSMLQKAGVKVLENDSMDIEGTNIRITGLELGREYFQKLIMKKMEDKHVDKVVGHSDTSRFQVLIAHNPQYFPQYAAWGADLTVSGHVHGGIIRLPIIGGVVSPAIALFPKYDGGLFDIDGKKMVLSRGLGTHSINVRLFNPCELCIIHVRGV
ncbi:MAG: metallophosphoesterase [Butyrivibrio sp.]|nr:metallophosphoesterase [Butyrivibrio sp.]